MLPQHHPIPAAHGHAGTDVTGCPLCAGDLIRVRRRPVDRIAGWVAPSRRYRCLAFRCQWEGNLRRQRGDFGDTTQLASLPADDAESEADGRALPRAFVVSMVLSVLGTAFVVVAASTDWLFPVDPAFAQSSEDSWRSQPAIVAKTPAGTAPAAK